jgi:N4-gp56 family major capsid protein
MANKIGSAVANDTTYVPLTQTILDIYSKEIEFQAQPVMRFAQFAVKKTDLSAAPGLKIKMTIYNNLTPGGKLTEGVAMNTQALSTSQREISVAEYGNAIAVTELLLQASFDDVMASSSKLLGMDYAKTVDTLLRDTVLGGTQVVFAGGRTADTALVADDTFSSDVVKDAVEVLGTANAPKYNNDFYVCFLHPHQVRGLKNDPEFMNITEYGKQYAGEVGRVQDVIFIETTQMPKLAVSGQSFDKYQSVMFGENAYGFAVALPVEMRDGGIEDFGRVHKLAWYAIFGAGILEDVNIVRIETR